MKTLVPRPTRGVYILLADGRPACAKCFTRPKREYPRNGRIGARRYYSYCRECQTEYARARRVGKIETLVTVEEMEVLQLGLTAEEIEGIRLARAASPGGRHHAAAS